MAYWIYNMGLAVPVSSQQLLSKRKVLPLEKLAKNPATPGSDDEHAKSLTTDLARPSAEHPSIAQQAYQKNDQNSRQQIYRADQIMSTPVLTLTPKTSLKQAWTLFSEKRFRHFVVTDKSNALLGIVSDRDVLNRAAELMHSGKPWPKNDTVGQIMTSSVLTTTGNTPIKEVCQVMFNQHVGALPVTDNDGQLQGIITRSDILRSMIKHGPLELWI